MIRSCKSFFFFTTPNELIKSRICDTHELGCYSRSQFVIPHRV